MLPAPHPENQSAAFLAGGGELGARMRAIDWSQTSLGRAADWPQSLKTCVRIILTSRQPMFVWWGEELINLYNDAYISIVGGKHPWALGQPASAVWREIWDEAGPRASSAMQSNEGTYDEALLLIMERHGYAEETYYTFSYSPVPNDQGGTGGIICANTDDTQRIIGERQLALLREVAARSADARTIEEACTRSAIGLDSNPRDLPFALLYLVDRDRHQATLAGATRIDRNHPAAPPTIAIDDASIWPIGEVMSTQKAVLIGELQSKFEALPQGAWPRAPHQAVVVPIAATGSIGSTGVLIVGLNPFRIYDASYSRFVELIASQIAASIGNAQAYEEERSRAEGLAKLDRAKTAFFSNVSHEFRTPLTLMLGPIEDILGKPEHEVLPENRELLTIVHRNAQRLLKLVNTLLDFSRIEAGRVQARYEPVDLGVFTAELASIFRSAIEKAGMRLLIDTPSIGEPAYVDRDMWEKIVLNVVSNAFKYTLEGEIAVSVKRTDGHVELAVRDTGIGIPADELPKLFNRFHRVEGARGRTHEGTGIGLALVQELARLHGGTVSVESEMGVGSTFRVTIPLGTAHLPADRIGGTKTLAPTSVAAQSYVEEALRWLPESETHPIEPAEVPTFGVASNAKSRARIIVADDNADMREYLRRLLASVYDVTAVSDGAEALRIATREKPDLVLTDVMMPVLDGFGLLRELRAQPETASIPVLMLSARAGEESRVEGLEAGADDYLVKPFSARELVARVGGLLAVTQVREEAKQLLEAERLSLREIFMRAPAFIATLRGPQHVFEIANPLYMKIVGESREIVGRPIREALPEVEAQGFFELLDRVYQTGEPFVGNEMKVQVNRGDTLQDAYVDFVYHPIRDARGAVDGIFVHGNDVTEQVLARHEVERQAAELERANLALIDQIVLNKAITHNAASSLFRVDESGCVTFMNPAAEALTGYKIDELRDRTLHEALHHHHPDGSVFPAEECPLDRSRNGNQPLKDHRDTFIRKDGTFFPVSCYVAPLTGRLKGAVVEFRDITDELRAQEVLKEADRRKDEFIATLSHELRTPLTAILGWARILRMPGNDPDTIHLGIETINRSAEVQSQLIDDVLDISRVTTGKLQIASDVVDVAVVAESALETVRLAAQAKQVRIESNLDVQGALVLGDPNRLQQVLWNLLSNAIKFTPAGGVVSLEVRRGAKNVEVEVRDTGIGIRSDFLPHIFEAFRQADSATTRVHGGLGLGLSIVRYLIDLHGGHIVAESEGEGRGARFVVELPHLRTRTRVTTTHDHATPVQLDGVSVLVIDDQQDVREYLGAALRRAGARVQEAESVRNAIDVVKDERFDLVLCDLAMPHEDGFAFIEWMRGEGKRDEPVYAITAFGRAHHDEQRAYAAGFSGFIRKPVEPDALTRTVADALTGRT